MGLVLEGRVLGEGNVRPKVLPEGSEDLPFPPDECYPSPVVQSRSPPHVEGRELVRHEFKKHLVPQGEGDLSIIGLLPFMLND